jgi:feruloyl esterase
MVFSNSSWTYKGTNLSDSLSAADSKMAETLNSTDANLKPFQARGGKLILYHGWSDAAIPPVNAISYYQSVTQAMGESTVDSFLRLYLPPGMQHCAGGPGPNLFGQFGVLKAGDAQHDIFTSLVDWIEKGPAPSAIVATKYVKDDPAKPAEMTRPLCPYPLVAKYDGSGDEKKAESFSCAAAP